VLLQYAWRFLALKTLLRVIYRYRLINGAFMLINLGRGNGDGGACIVRLVHRVSLLFLIARHNAALFDSACPFGVQLLQIDGVLFRLNLRCINVGGICRERQLRRFISSVFLLNSRILLTLLECLLINVTDIGFRGMHHFFTE
jgi:hypothetical protein